MEIQLRYGCNPHQQYARLISNQDDSLKILNGSASYINMLDALAAWQAADELRQVTGVPGAASFKHFSPAGLAIAKPLSETYRVSQFLPDEPLSPIATAYARARGGDRLCAFGDAIGVSDTVDVTLANLIKREVSDLIIAPAYDPEALDILKKKKNGKYLVLQIDPSYTPPEIEKRELFGFTLEQTRNNLQPSRDLLKNIVTKRTDLPEDAVQSLLVATVALKYAQSNSICVAYDGQVIGLGAGQQSRVHCTRLACGKADKWLLQQHPDVLALSFKEGLGRPDRANIVDQFLLWDELSDMEKDTMRQGLTSEPHPIDARQRLDWITRHDSIVLSSDAFFPFRDSIDRASRSGVQYVLQAGGSLRDQDVIDAADSYGMVMINSGVRWFTH